MATVSHSIIGYARKIQKPTKIPRSTELYVHFVGTTDPKRDANDQEENVAKIPGERTDA